MKKKMTKNKKILLIILIATVSVVVAFGAFSGTTYALYKSEKKAVIILPGLFASGLYNEDTGEAVWDPFVDLDVEFNDFMNIEGGLVLDNMLPLIFEDSVNDELEKILANDNAGESDSLLNIMAMNEDGTPAVESVKGAPWDFEGRTKFGAINAQKGMYESLYEKYKDDYEVEIFNYDFRLDNRYNAQLLEEHINQQGYKEVILVSHSNGGHVAAFYLARSQENRDKVTKYISYNAPYLGSFSAITILENVDDMLAGVLGIADSVPALFRKPINNILGNVEEVFDKQFKKLLNMWTVYHLLPDFDLLTKEYNGEQAAIYIDGDRKIFEDEIELWEFYCSRPWARHESGELKPAMENWLEYKNDMKVTLSSGEKVYSPTLVDTTYYSGMDVEGVNKVYFETNPEDNSLVMTETQTTTESDGTVLLTSAVIFEENPDKIIYWSGVSHYGVNVAFADYCEEDTYAAIDSSLEEPSWYYNMWRQMLKK